MQVLRDRVGIYGVVGGSDEELKILTRADHVEPTRDRIAYQMILPNHAAFKHTNEQKLYGVMHRQLLREAGFPETDWESWRNNSDRTAHERDGLRRRYFGLGRVAARRVNQAMAESLTAADPNVLRVVRRYPIRFRAPLFTACCRLGIRVTQFCEIFPVLALVLFTKQFRSENMDATRRMREDGQRMILRGERLRNIAEMLGFAMVFRRVKPGAAEQAVVTEVSDELVARYLPETLPAQRRWFAAVSRASQFGIGFMEWTAQRVGEVAASQKETIAELNDIADWVKASRLAVNAGLGVSVPSASSGSEFITRPFRTNMSLRTVRVLSRDWHEAVAKGMRESACVQFPRPWLSGARIGGFRILPITDSGTLYLEGKALHHCVATFADDIVRGDKYLYSVRREHERVATLELRAGESGIRLGEMRALCNTRPAKSCERAIQQWFRQERHALEPGLAAPAPPASL